VGLVHRFFWRPGAVPAVVREWADHLEAAGHEVAVFASDVQPAQGTLRRSYGAVRLPRGKLFDLAGIVFAAGLLAKLLRRRSHRLDVILATDSTAYFGVWLAGRLLRVPTIMAFQGWIYSPGKRGVYPRTVTWMYKLAVQFCARWAPKIACLSREVYDGLRAFGASPDRLWLAPNCVDLGRWPGEKQGAHARSARRVLYVGGLRGEKGIDILLEAVPRVLARMPATGFLIAGGEESEGGEYHQMARRLGIREQVTFGGLVPRESLAAAYAEADVLVVPSRAEGHALAPMECLACGTPVIASDLPGLRMTVQDGVNGLLVPPEKPAALADAICRALQDEGLLDRLSRAARASVERFSWDIRVREFEELCQRLAGR
jgi:glycosyltransferase involved in cell wall biosynthesis